MNEENVARFEKILLETKRKGIENLIDYIRTTDFYTAPASTRFHSCHEGGLLEHSLNVYDCLTSKYQNNILIGDRIQRENLAIVALLHDICKANFYAIEMRNKKDENGNWVKVPFYTVDDKLPYGHGEKSVYITNSFINLTRGEAMGIRWHMGFSEAKENFNALGKAIREYPIILAVFESDLESTYLLEEEE